MQKSEFTLFLALGPTAPSRPAVLAAPACLRVFLAGIETIFAWLQLTDHVLIRCGRRLGGARVGQRH